MCAWEVGEAARLSKRILPIVCRPLEGASPPPRLRDLNYTYFYDDPKAAPGAGFGSGLAKLLEALNTDFDWLREHTRYLQRATEWDRGGRPVNRLLSGDDIAEANAWAARRPKGAPEPTALHLEFFRASEEEAQARLSEQRKQLEAVAAAQAAKETALHDREEAFKQAADAQRRRTRIRNIALVVVSILAVIAGFAGLVSWTAEQEKEQEMKLAEQQRIIAEEQKTRAEHERLTADQVVVGATGIILKFRDKMDDHDKKETFAVFQAGANHGDVVSMRILGILYYDVKVSRRTTPRVTSGSRGPPIKATRSQCPTSARYTPTVRA
jgi:hypothetical protein